MTYGDFIVMSLVSALYMVRFMSDETRDLVYYLQWNLLEYLKENYGSRCWRCIHLSDEFTIRWNGERVYWCDKNGNYTEDFINLAMVNGCGEFHELWLW